MKRTKLADREMPDYTEGEELFNTLSHFAGAALGVVALIWCLVLAVGPLQIITSIIYSLSMILLYTTSGIYHGLKDSMTKRIFQVLDHCAIYVFIAGTYTIVMLCSIRLENAAIAWVIVGIEWAMAAIAVTLTAIDLKRFQVFSLACYIILGWVGIIAIKPAIRSLGGVGAILLLAGGISYTLGSVLYVIGKKQQYFHSIFHIFILLGSLLHFFCIVFFVL
ncbi:MAG: PAQR family membrane homeostasis protein TrhA [Candidatus Geothermincolia bacterium]